MPLLNSAFNCVPAPFVENGVMIPNNRNWTTVNVSCLAGFRYLYFSLMAVIVLLS